jgi:type II secretion system protein N
MRPSLNRRTVLTYAGYAALALVMTLYIAVVTFPFEQVKDQVLPSLVRGMPFSLDLEELRATPFLSIRASGVRIWKDAGGTKHSKGPQLVIETLTVRPSLLSLFTGKKAASFSARFYGGKAQGTIGVRGQSVTVAGRWKDIDLGTYEPAAEAMKLAGKLSGDLDLSIPRRKPALAEGSVSLRIADGSVQNLQVYSMTVPALTGIAGSSTVRIQKEKDKDISVASLQECTLNGKEAAITLTGEVRLATPLAQSRLNIKGNLKLMGDFASRYDTMLQGLLRNKNKDGSYPFSLMGTLGQPRFGV